MLYAVCSPVPGRVYYIETDTLSTNNTDQPTPGFHINALSDRKELFKTSVPRGREFEGKLQIKSTLYSPYGHIATYRHILAGAE